MNLESAAATAGLRAKFNFNRADIHEVSGNASIRNCIYHERVERGS